MREQCLPLLVGAKRAIAKGGVVLTRRHSEPAGEAPANQSLVGVGIYLPRYCRQY